MSKEEYKIIFRDLEMNMEEAKDYLSRMKDGKINLELTEEERKLYLEHRRNIESTNELSKRRTGKNEEILKLLNEEEYLISRLKKEIRLAELLNSQNSPNKNKNLKTSSRNSPCFYYKRY